MRMSRVGFRGSPLALEGEYDKVRATSSIVWFDKKAMCEVFDLTVHANHPPFRRGGF